MSWLGQTTPPLPPPPAPTRWGALVGWGAVLLAATGLFYAASTGMGTGRRVATNRKRRRRSSRLRVNRRRSSRRRRTRRRHRSSRRNPKLVGNLKRYKALSAAARRRMPSSAFALPGKRFPIKGPPGSSRERDKWQALQAIRYLHMGRVGTKSEYLAVRNAIIGRYGMKFWRDYDGPSWAKVERAKRRRRTTRRRRPTRRRVAANRRRSSRRRVARNARRKTKRRTSAYGRARGALRTIRSMGVSGDPLPSKLGKRRHAMLARRGEGLYRISGGRSPSIIKFSRSTSMRGAMTNVRIASSASGDQHWLVKVYRSGRPRLVVIRHIGGDGKTRYRVEDYAKALREVARKRRVA